jgi:hypothetical protein
MQVKFLPVHNMKAYRWSRGIAPPILKLGTNWRWAVTSRPDLFTPGKDSTPIVYEAGWAPGLVWKFLEKNFLLPGSEPQTAQQAAQSLYGLRHPGSQNQHIW